MLTHTMLPYEIKTIIIVIILCYTKVCKWVLEKPKPQSQSGVVSEVILTPCFPIWLEEHLKILWVHSDTKAAT